MVHRSSCTRSLATAQPTIRSNQTDATGSASLSSVKQVLIETGHLKAVGVRLLDTADVSGKAEDAVWKEVLKH